MDLFKYIVVFVGSIILGIIIGFVAKSVFSGIGITILVFGMYIVWNMFEGAKRDSNPPQNPPVSNI